VLDREIVAPGGRVTATVAAGKPVHAILLRWLAASEDHGIYRVVATKRVASGTAVFTVGERGAKRGVFDHYAVVLDSSAPRVGSKFSISVDSTIVYAPLETWSGDTLPVALAATSTAATLRVTNPTRKQLAVHVAVGRRLTFIGMENEPAIADSVRDEELAPGETRTLTFAIAAHAGPLAVVASVETGNEMRAVATTTAP